MTKAAIWSILILATATVIFGLVYFAEMLTQVAVALILWLVIEATALHIRRLLPRVPAWAAMTIAIVGILGIVGLVGYEVVRKVGDMAARLKDYEASFNAIMASTYSNLHITSPPPTVASLTAKIDYGAQLPRLLGGVQNIASNVIFISIYLGFMFSAAARIHLKLDRIFPDEGDRAHTRDVLTAIRRSMAQYLWVQTVLSAITTVLTYICLKLVGLENAEFWSFLIFFLNYIPTIGSIAAVVLPTAFALVQFNGDATHIGLVALGIGFWQFSVGNLVAPRMMGESLNLSSLVILISLTFWSQIWGIVGAFLAAPLMVMIMLTLAQFDATRWIAILLSEDGQPGVPRRAPQKVVPGVG
jgi:predicted PurR-regulated permease PerM